MTDTVKRFSFKTEDGKTLTMTTTMNDTVRISIMDENSSQCTTVHVENFMQTMEKVLSNV